MKIHDRSAVKKIDYYNLLHKFFDQEISDRDLILLRSWLGQDPENLRIFDKENELWQSTSYYLNPDIFETEKSWKKISSRLGVGAFQQENDGKRGH